jgi:hypothetical protein
MAKTRKLRKGPNNSASEGVEGTIEWGNNKSQWVIKKIENLLLSIESKIKQKLIIEKGIIYSDL